MYIYLYICTCCEENNTLTVKHLVVITSGNINSSIIKSPQFLWGCCSVAKSCPILCDPWTTVDQASLSFTISLRLLRLLIGLVMLSNHLILCCPFLLLPSIFPT